MLNAQFKTHYVKRICESKLGIGFRRRRGKEFNGWFLLGNTKVARITVPKGRKTIGRGLYKSMAKQLKLTVDGFDSLLVCELLRGEYEDILREQEPEGVE